MLARQPDPRRRLLMALALERSRSPEAADALLRRALEGDARARARLTVPSSAAPPWRSDEDADA